ERQAGERFGERPGSRDRRRRLTVSSDRDRSESGGVAGGGPGKSNDAPIIVAEVARDNGTTAPGT
ncbi:MAG: hypothetical protein ACYC6Y_22590, partial [Thermoguttaceae bacterium]